MTDPPYFHWRSVRVPHNVSLLQKGKKRSDDVISLPLLASFPIHKLQLTSYLSYLFIFSNGKMSLTGSFPNKVESLDLSWVRNNNTESTISQPHTTHTQPMEEDSIVESDQIPECKLSKAEKKKLKKKKKVLDEIDNVVKVANPHFVHFCYLYTPNDFNNIHCILSLRNWMRFKLSRQLMISAKLFR